MRIFIQSLLATTLLVGLIAPASAQDFQLTAEVASDIPIMIGARALVEHTPTRIRLSTGVGYLPESYVALINNIVVSAGGYDRKTADLIETSLKDSLVWRIDLGWRPFENYGFYFDLGYRYVGLGGDISSAVALEQATGFGIPPEIADAGVDVDFQLYQVETSIHMLNAEIGWEWLVAEHWSLRAALGGVATLKADSSVESSFDIPGGLGAIPGLGNSLNQITEVEESGVAFLNKNLEKHLHAPLLTLSAGWRF